VAGESVNGPAPTLGRNIGMGYAPIELAKPGCELQIDCRGKLVFAQVVTGPFYRRSK
jgi:aminomethyltransferase